MAFLKPQAPDLTLALRPPQPTSATTAPADLRKRLNIRTLLILSFLLQTLAAIGLTGALAIRNSQRAVDSLAQQLQSEANETISTRLDSYLKVPQRVNQINADAVELGILQVSDLNKLGTYFWRQMKAFEDIGYINFASEEGRFIGIERTEDNQLLVNEARAALSDPLQYVYMTDDRGYRTELDEVINDPSDVTQEGWYADAAQAQKPVWSEIYQWDDNPEILSISSSFPIYNAAEDLIGVIGVDLILNEISDFLKQVEISPSAQIFILERDGRMVASSDDSPIYQSQNDEVQRLRGEEMADPLIREAVIQLREKFGDLNTIQSAESSVFSLSGKKHFLQVTPWQDDAGLDWLMVVAIPASDFTAQAAASTRDTILLCGLLAAAVSLLGVLLSRWLSAPLAQLSKAAKAIASGDLTQRVDDSGVGELGAMANAFNQMSEQLQASFGALARSNVQLENRVAERTAALIKSTQALESEVAHLLDVVGAVEAGDLTVSAQVSPLATGLVADMLNRLIEHLNQVMSTVLTVATQVTQGANYSERLASEVAFNAQQQANAVAQVENLLEDIDALSNSAAQQANRAIATVQTAQAAIGKGQAEMASMGEGIAALKGSTEQIVRRSQTLSDYVSLAARFTQEQKRIAAMTQVLALNASMLSKRAAEGQIHEEGTVIASSISHELTAIATQVNDLAVQTNQSLLALTQRTDQIQAVINGLKYDLQNINQQVNTVSTGVAYSQATFDSIHQAGDQVMSIAQKVTYSSQTIATATASTLAATRDISVLANETSLRTKAAQEQSKQMEAMAQTLVDNVEVFQLQSESANGGASAGFSQILDAHAETILPSSDDEAPLLRSADVPEADAVP
jgi:methyl-accepting chemotaxis protein